MLDLEKTKHYTTQSEKICGNLVSYIPEDAKLIEPFVGGGDLLTLFPNYSWECYDIEDKGNNVVQDTLLNPPSYSGKWVITNPPYLAKNKAKDKKVFEKYKADDLYKCFLLSMLDAEGGLIIIPTNFFSDERTSTIRRKFFQIFSVEEINIFTEPVFESTTYSVCSFVFRKRIEEGDCLPIINVLPSGETCKFLLEEEYDYRFAGRFFDKINKVKPIFGRLVGQTSEDFITNIKLYGLDTRKERIHVAYEEEPYCGKQTDRVYATFTSKVELSEETQRQLVDSFNEQFEDFRRNTYDLGLTNYRDYNRKRVGFTFAYQFMTYVYENL